MASKNTENFRLKVIKNLESKANWQVFCNRNWICPYCAEVGVEKYDRYPDPAIRVMRHLLKECPASGGEELSTKELKHRIFQIKTHQMLKAEIDKPLWNLRDRQKRWYCPYCAQPTEITTLKKRAFLKEVVKHLQQCFGYKKGGIKSEDYLRKIIAYENKVQILVGVVKKNLQTNPKWKVSGRRGEWICVFCQTSLGHIDVTNPLALSVNVPTQIAHHLLSACSKFQWEKFFPQSSPSPKSPSASSAGPKKSGSKITTISIPSVQETLKRKPELFETNQGIEFAETQVDDEDDLEAVPLISERQLQNVFTQAADTLENFLSEDALEAVFVEEEEATVSSATSAESTSPQDGVREEFATTSEFKATISHLDVLPLMPEVESLEFQYVYETKSSEDVDFLDFIPISSRQVGILAIQLQRAIAKQLVHQMKEFIQVEGPKLTSPKEFVLLFHKNIWTKLSIPLSLSYLILDVEKEVLRLCQVNHHPLALLNPLRNRYFHLLQPKGSEGFSLEGGQQDERELGELRVRLKKEDLIILHSKGILQAKDDRGVSFGKQRLYELMQRYGRHEAEYFRDKFMEKFSKFHSKRSRENIFILAIKYHSQFPYEEEI
ncbi:MAG: hypothetical protein D6805_05240 [Planctomycetota bacterium]|nr:MAG: hypothetical protein D6805_05240 [Planctomycetota bacterium]